MAQPNVHGRFVWQELIVRDTAAAVAFYSKVVGWRTQTPPAMPDYTVFTAGSTGVAGLQHLSGDAKPHWLPYLGVQDVDETAAAAVRLGGKLLQAPFDLSNGGRIAVVADPQGAPFGLHHSNQPGPAPSASPGPGEFSWQELATTDYEAAFRFYSELFGWQVMERVTMGPTMVYLIFGWNGAQRGGIYKSTKPGAGAYWLPYASVTDIDAAVAAVARSGGQVVHGPVSVPGGGRVAQLLDNNGALFAVHMAPAAQPAPSPTKPAPAPVAAKPPKAAAPAVPVAAARATPAAKTPAAAPAPKPAAAPVSAAKSAARKAPAKVAKKAAKQATRKAAKKAAKKAARKVASKAAKKPVAKRAPPKKKAKSAARHTGASRRAGKRAPAPARRAARRKK
jgi:predicted enzyme related to lactoylglutathione lyase